MAIFTLSCFGLLLYLWSAFGGAVPLKPHGYRFNASFDEATQLAQEADVRISGVNVGKVKKIDLGDDGRTDATIEIEDEYAPMPEDSRAILRQKTLLGETYVELTPGTEAPARSPRTGASRPTRSRPPSSWTRSSARSTRRRARASRSGSRTSAQGIEGHGADFSDALGSLTPFASDTNEVLKILNSQERATQEADQEHRRRCSTRSRSATTSSPTWIIELEPPARDDGRARRPDQGDLAGVPDFIDESQRRSGDLEAYADNTDPLMTRPAPVGTQLEPTPASTSKELRPTSTSSSSAWTVRSRRRRRDCRPSSRFLDRPAQPARPAGPVPAQLQPVPPVPRPVQA